MRASILGRVPARRLFLRSRTLVLRFLPAGAVVLSVLTFGSYVMGLLRDKALAHTFGAGPELDAYFAAFRLPELAFDVLVAGGLVAPFVPIFLGLKGEAAETAQRFARTVLTVAIGVMIVASIVLFVFAPQSADWIVPGFTDDQREMYVGLFRTMLATQVVFAASLVVGEILVAERRFVAYGLASLMYNAGIVAGAVLLAEPLGIYAAAAGALVGAFAHLGIRLVGLYRTSVRLRPSFDLRTKGFGTFLKLMAPKMVSQPIEPLTYIYFTGLASTLTAGSVTAYTFAQSFQQLPVTVVGMSFAIAAFPALSAAIAAGDRPEFGRLLRRNLLTIGLLSLAAAAGMFVLGGIAIRVFLGGGAFDEEDVAATSLVLAVFTLSIPLESLVHLLARALYATRNTLLPTLAAVLGFAATVMASAALAGPLGIAAIPAGYSIGMAVRLGLISAALAVRMAAGAGIPGRQSAAVRRGFRPAQAFMAVGVAAVLLASLAGAGRAWGNASVGGGPATTPWARVLPPAATLSPAGPDEARVEPSDAAGPIATPSGTSTFAPAPSASRTPLPVAKRGPFSMDLYEKGDYVGEFTDKWCVPAAMQTSMNIMDKGADTTRNLQLRLFNLANSFVPGRWGGAEPEGWAQALAKLGYGKYEVRALPSIVEAAQLMAKQVRLTNRPGGFMVWKGWHSWVISGFEATADPALFDDFTVTGVYVEDVWYNRFSTIWGYSDPPDTLVAVENLSKDYKPWRMGKASYYPDKDGKFVAVIPVN